MIYQALVTDYNNNKGWNFDKRGYEYGYKYAYYEFTEDGYIEYIPEDIKEIDNEYVFVGNNKNAGNHTQHEFDNWNNVDVIITDIGDEQYVRFEFSHKSTKYHFSPILLKKGDANNVEKMYINRNDERCQMKKSIYSFVDERVLELAENLVNIIEEDIMLNWRIVATCNDNFSHLNQMDTDTNSKYYGGRFLQIDSSGTKGKKKVEIEKQSAKIQQQYRAFAKIFSNLVEIITEEKGLKSYVARAVAWEAVTIKLIEYYGQKWEAEYGSELDIDYDEIYDNSDSEKSAVREYIKEVISCGEIDVDSSKEILMYYMLYKSERVIGHNLPQSFDSFYNLFKEIAEKVNSQDIKNKLKTKQKRRISKYTIDDVDLMTGTEFEEFVGLLFKKMGYSSQVTKQSGDQGLDVIATKNGTKIGVQAKCYSNTVGNSAVQEAVAGKSFYNCDKVIVITNNFFTPAAIELAQSNGVILWNRDMLKEKLKELM